jgi:hypothetical protein
MKKTDWVTFKSKGVDQKGIVQSIGKDGLVKVAYGWNKTNYFIVKAPERFFTITEAPVLDGGSGFLTKWSFKGLKQMQGHDGYMMNVTIYKNGKKAFAVVDDGNGGGLSYEGLGKPCYTEINEFTKEANELWQKFSVDKKSGQVDQMVDWLLNINTNPIAIEAKVAEWDAFCAEMAIKYPKAE